MAPQVAVKSEIRESRSRAGRKKESRTEKQEEELGAGERARRKEPPGGFPQAEGPAVLPAAVWVTFSRPLLNTPLGGVLSLPVK